MFPSSCSWIHLQLKRKSLQNCQSQPNEKTTQPYCFKTSTASREVNNDKLKEKWIHNLSRKPLTSAENSLLQKCKKFVISLISISVIDYITPTKCIWDSLGENNIFGKTDCMEYYAKIKNVLTTFTDKPKPIFFNITKEERIVLHNLKKDDSHMVLTTDKELSWSL